MVYPTTHHIIVIIHPATNVVQAIDQRIHAGIGRGKDEESLANQRVDLAHRGLVPRVPHADEVVWSPAYDEHNHNRDGHLQGAFLCPTQHIIVGSTKSLGDHILEHTLILAIDLQIDGAIAVNENDQGESVKGAHRGDLIEQVVEVGHQCMEGDALKVSLDSWMLLQVEEKGLCVEGNKKKEGYTVEKTMLKWEIDLTR